LQYNRQWQVLPRDYCQTQRNAHATRRTVIIMPVILTHNGATNYCNNSGYRSAR